MTDQVGKGKDGELVLPLAGFVCSAWESGELVLTSPESAKEARVSGDGLDDKVGLDLFARGARIEQATATADSTLRIDFDGDTSVVIPPSDAAGAWTVLGPGTIAVIARVGGGEPEVGETHSFGPGDPVPPWVAEALQSVVDHFGEGEDE